MKSILTLLLLSYTSVALTQSPDYFLRLLEDNSRKQVLLRTNAFDSAKKLDTALLIPLLDKMEKKAASRSDLLQTRVAAMKARLFFYVLGPGDSLYAAHMKAALQAAYELDQPMMVAEYARWYSEMLHSTGRTNEAVQYALNSVVLQEQSGIEYFPSVRTFYLVIGEFLFLTANYADAVRWLNKGLADADGEGVSPLNYANALNNLALSYFRLKKYEESLGAYQSCMQFSREQKLDNWFLIARLNRLSPFISLGFYDSARALVNEAYEIAKRGNDFYTMGESYFVRGRIANKEHNFPEALKWLNLARNTVPSLTKQFRYMLCEELAMTYEGLGQPDQSLICYKEFKAYSDSVTQAESALKTEFLMTKANYEKEMLMIREAKRKRDAGTRLRNAGLLLLVLFSGGALFWLNRKRSQARREQQAAQQQLLFFTNSIREKDKQLEMLQAHLQQQAADLETAGQVDELSRQMILTGADWQRFRELFNQTYPGFLFRLQEKFAGITEAEIRMACLIRIRLTTRQIAHMQGISPDSVHKTRQRLRQRFSISTTTELESIIGKL